MAVQQISVSGRNMEIGETLPVLVEQQMADLGKKYFGRIVNCRVVFSKGKGNSRTCAIQITVGRDMHYASSAQSDDVHGCFRDAYEHVAKQLRRQKRALHEDKPNGHGKEQVLNSMLQPDSDGVAPIDGNDLSVVEVSSDEPAKAIERLYGR